MQKSKKFTVVVPVFFAIALIAAQAQAGVTITIGKSGDAEAEKVAAALAAKAGDGEVDSIAQFFKESASARYVMTSTEDGRALMSKVIKAPEGNLTATSYNRFLDRVNWKSNVPVRNSLYQRLRQLDDDFANFRKENGSDTKLKSTDALSPAESAFLKDRLAQITRDQKLADLFEHQTDFVSTVPQGYEASRVEMTSAQPQAPVVENAPAEPAAKTVAKKGTKKSTRTTKGKKSAAPDAPSDASNDPAPAQAPAQAPEQAPAAHPANESIPPLVRAPEAPTEAPAAAQPERSNIELARTAGSAVSVLQDPSVKAAESTLAGIQIKLRTINGFFKFMRLSEGDWRSLLGMGGEDFSPNDVLMIRKLNRLMGTLNEYAKTRLTIQTFTLQSPGLYNQLNAATLDKTTSFLSGELGEQAYLDARAAAAKTLGMDDIVNTAETRMVQTIDQARAMGGTAKGAGDGIIPAKEAEVKTEELKLTEATSRVESAQKEVESLKSEGADSDKIIAAQRKLEMATADRDLSTTRVKSASTQLKSYYWKFIQNYEPIEIFKGLREGKINSDPAQVFDLPDSMVVDPADYETWGKIYERALNSVADTAVKSEIWDFFAGKAGATRSFIREMNDDTGKLFGTKFTDSQYGVEFKNYTQSLMMTFVKRMVAYVGAPAVVTTAVADPKPYENVIDKAWNWVFGSGKPATPAPSKEDASDKSDKPDSSVKPAPSASTAKPDTSGKKPLYEDGDDEPGN